jgi:hypothetical protein
VKGSPIAKSKAIFFRYHRFSRFSDNASLKHLFYCIKKDIVYAIFGNKTAGFDTWHKDRKVAIKEKFTWIPHLLAF